MAAQLRVYRRRIRSVQATMKITRAMELIAASRIVRARQQVEAASPYAEAITRAVSACASFGHVDHPLTRQVQVEGRPLRAAMLLVTSDRGLAGAYSSNAIRAGEQLRELLHSQGAEVLPYLVGRKAVNYYRFRGRSYEAEWTGFSEAPTYLDAKAVADTLLRAFLAPAEEGGVDEIHLVSTRFVNVVVQTPQVRRLLPLEVTETTEEPPGGAFPLYEFEPSPEGVLDALLPRYIESRVFSALLQAAASEHAARRRAMKSATDNAEDLIRALTRDANAARQAEITQEISEIVGGAEALTATAVGE